MTAFKLYRVPVRSFAVKRFVKQHLTGALSSKPEKKEGEMALAKWEALRDRLEGKAPVECADFTDWVLVVARDPGDAQGRVMVFLNEDPEARAATLWGYRPEVDGPAVDCSAPIIVKDTGRCDRKLPRHVPGNIEFTRLG